MDEAKRMLDLAARLAMRAVGYVEPNPLVGAVVARDGVILGLGHHRRFGGPHAEREALEDCARRGADPRGATMYVTLEPCSHVGKQPACAPAIAQAGIARVVYARSDPHPRASGGAELLREFGVQADVSAASTLATRVSDPFVKRIERSLPWVIAKWAQTIDGRIATRAGESQWISNTRSRARVHRVRARVDAVLTGIGTVMADDPQLTAREARRVRRAARRVVVDTDLAIPLTSALVRTARAVPVTVACDQEHALAGLWADKRRALEAAGVEIMGVAPLPKGGLDLERIFRRLVDDHDVTNVLVEAGQGILGSLLEADLVDQAIVYVAPLMLGDELARSVATGRVAESLTAGRRFELARVRRVGDDVEMVYRRPVRP